MNQGRISLSFASLLAFVISIVVVLSSCSGKKPRASDCFSCTETPQVWNAFSWSDLEGSWRGSLETVSNVLTAAQKERKHSPVSIHFFSGENFLKAKEISGCGDFPKRSIVLMGQLWSERDDITGLNVATGRIVLPNNAGGRVPAGISEEKTFEVFGEMDSGEVSYGRAYIRKVNGQSICSYNRLGGKFFQNRLALPAMSFSRRMTSDGRILASGQTPEYELSLEFLDFRPGAKEAFADTQSRLPASTEVHDRPQLFLRVFKMARNVEGSYARGEWTGTKEFLYRLWKN